MKKSFIALAVAGAVAAPMTANAADVVISGVASINLMLADTESYEGKDRTKKGVHVTNNDIQIGATATEDVGFAQAFGTMRIDLDNLSGSGITEIDSIAVGLKGSFGTVTLGEGPDFAEKGQLAGDLAISSDQSMMSAGAASTNSDAGTFSASAIGALGTPNASLSYEIPSVVPGLTAGINLINTTYSTADISGDGKAATSGGVSLASEAEKSGIGYGVGYSLDLGSSGSLSFGYGGSTTETKTVIYDTTKNSLEDFSKAKAQYSSLGVSYAIAGFSIGVAQQKISGLENTQYAAYNGTDPAANVSSENEDVTSTDIKLGYATGPISVSYSVASVDNILIARTGTTATLGNQLEDSSNSDDEGHKTTISRIDFSYALSDSVSISARNQVLKSESGSKGGNIDYEAGYTRVTMGINF